MCAGIFFLGYCISMIPSNLVIVRLGGRLWLGIIICAWGVVGAATAAVKTPCEQPSSKVPQSSACCGAIGDDGS